jgi:hypothetical protein
MRSRTIYRCPHDGCTQTSPRRWNMNVHIKRRHGFFNNSVNATQGPTPGSGFVPISMDSQYDYGKRYPHAGTPFKAYLSQSQKEAEVIRDPIVESLRRINEFMRLFEEFRVLSTKNSISTTHQSLLMALVNANSYQSKHNRTAKRARLPTGYRIWFCDRCGKGYKLHAVFYSIEFEGLTKPLHGCEFYAVCESGFRYTPDTKSPEQSWLEEYLIQTVFFRIGQGDAYLKAERAFSNVCITVK